MSRTWLVASAGRRVTVCGPDALGTWWAALSAQIPGTACGPLPEAEGSAALVLPDSITARDARLRINAHLHAEHLRYGTLSVHGVAVARGDQAIVLLGAHGAGKSLTGLALIAAGGWRPIAGDTSLIKAGCGGVRVAGGTRSYMVRRGESVRWFPGLAHADAGGERLDLAGLLGPWRMPAGPQEPAVTVVAVVRVDNSELACSPCDEPTARNAIYRASSHLIDRIPDAPDSEPLCLAETPGLARERARLARRAASGSCWLLRGSPHAMATKISRLAADGGAA